MGLNILSIRQKIWLIGLIALIGLASVLGMGGASINKSNRQVKALQQVYYPVLELASFNNVQLERIEEGLNTAVTIGDTDALQRTDQQFDELLKSLQSQQTLLPEAKAKITSISSHAKSYYQQSHRLALSMVDGSADFSQLASRAAEIADQLENLKDELKNFKAEAKDEFDALVMQVREGGQSTLTVMLVIGAIVVLVISIFTLLIGSQIRGSLLQVTNSLKEIAEGNGDLTVRVHHQGKDELAVLVHFFNLFLEKMQQSMSNALSTIDELSYVAEKLTTSSTATSKQIDLQGRAIDQTTEALQEMFTSVKHIAEHAAEASESASQADKDAQSGSYVVNLTIKSINELAEEVESTADVINQLEGYTSNVGSILEAIRGIAEQTNLLALNAAIEAARAGEQGRGFAVVADEVRTLASRTQDSTREIQHVLEELQTTAKSAVDAMGRGNAMARKSVEQSSTAGLSLQHITERVAAITVENDQIASATEEQHQTSALIQKYVAEIHSMAKEASVSTSELDGVSQSIKDVTQKLIQITNQFKV